MSKIWNKNLILISISFLWSNFNMAVEVNPYRKLTDSGEYYIANFYNLDPFVKDSLIRSNIINAKLNLPLEDYCRVITEYNQKTWLQYLNRNHQSLFEDHSMVISVLEKKPEVLIPYILSLSSLYLGWNKVTESYTLAQFAINKSLEQKEYFLLAKSYLQAGKSCSLKGDKLDAFRFLLKSKEICNQYNFNSLESEIWHVIGEYYHQLNSHLNSYEAFCSAEECIKKIEPVDTSILYLIYISKLEVMHSIDPSKFNEQEVYKILNWARTNNDKILEDKTAATLRHIYIETSNLEKIRLYYEVIAPQELKQLKTTNSFMYNKVMSYIAEAKNEIDSAEYFNLVAEKFLEDKSQSYYAFNFYFRLGEFYQRTNNIQKSILAFEKAYQKSLGLDLLSNVVEITKELSEEYKNIGDYKKSLKYLSLHTQNKDSLNSITNSEQLFILKLSNEERLRQIELENNARNEERRFNIQYLGILLILTAIFIVIILMGSYKWPEWTIRLVGFIAFIMLFEFIILILDQKIHHITHGEPWKILCIKIGIISIILPFHHWIEYKVINYLICHKMLKFKRPSFYGFLETFKNWFTLTQKEEKSIPKDISDNLHKV